MVDNKNPKKLIKTLKDLEKAIILAKTHKIPYLKIDEIEISFPKDHGPVEPQGSTKTAAEIEEDLLFNDQAIQ